MPEITKMSAVELLDAYSSRQLSPVEAMQAVLDQVEKRNGELNALAFLDGDRAMDDARASEVRWMAGSPEGAIDGVPITLKDSIAESSRPMWRGIRGNMGSPAVGYDSPVTQRVKEAHGNIFAKTTMPDFGGSGSGVSSAFGITRNAWNPAYNTAGSSSGAGAAVAACFGPLSIGSDLGGSVRVPAAHCGLVGLKPTQGRVAHLPSHVNRAAGPMTRTVADTALLLGVIGRSSPLDFYALPDLQMDYVAAIQNPDPRGKKIALVMEQTGGTPVDPCIQELVRAAAQKFADAGAVIEPIAPLTDESFMESIYTAFQQRAYAEYKKVAAKGPGATLDYFDDWYSGAGEVTAAQVALANDCLDHFKAEVTQRFTAYDYILSPIGAFSAFPAEAINANADGSRRASSFTPIWNQTGHPALSICCGFDPANGMPVGLQIAAHRFDDAGLLAMAAFYESERGFLMDWPA